MSCVGSYRATAQYLGQGFYESSADPVLGVGAKRGSTRYFAFYYTSRFIGSHASRARVTRGDKLLELPGECPILQSPSDQEKGVPCAPNLGQFFNRGSAPKLFISLAFQARQFSRPVTYSQIAAYCPNILAHLLVRGGE